MFGCRPDACSAPPRSARFSVDRCALTARDSSSSGLGRGPAPVVMRPSRQKKGAQTRRPGLTSRRRGAQHRPGLRMTTGGASRRRSIATVAASPLRRHRSTPPNEGRLLVHCDFLDRLDHPLRRSGHDHRRRFIDREPEWVPDPGLDRAVRGLASRSIEPPEEQRIDVVQRDRRVGDRRLSPRGSRPGPDRPRRSGTTWSRVPIDPGDRATRAPTLHIDGRKPCDVSLVLDSEPSRG